MSSTRFEPEDSTSGRWMYVQVRSSVLYMLPDDEPIGSKHVENIKKLKYYFRKSALCLFTFYKYITMHGAKNI